MLPPLPEPSPQPPQLADEDSGVRPALVRDVREAVEANKAPSLVRVAMIAAIAAIGSTGGAIVFLLAFAGESRAQAVQAAQAIAQVQSQSIEVVRGDVAALKTRLESIDAGVASKVQQLETKVDQASQRSEQRADEQEKLLRQLLVEVKKNGR